MYIIYVLNKLDLHVWKWNIEIKQLSCHVFHLPV